MAFDLQLADLAPTSTSFTFSGPKLLTLETGGADRLKPPLLKPLRAVTYSMVERVAW